MTFGREVFTLKNLLRGAAGIFLFTGMATTAHASLVISSDATSNVNCAAGVCTATAANAVLNANHLQSLLATHSVKVATGTETANIAISAPLTWISSTTLTLDAFRSVNVNMPIAVTGSGGLTVVDNDGGTSGMFSFHGKGSVNFWNLASVLVIDGNAYTLVNNIATLASDIAANDSGHFALANNYDATTDGVYAPSPVPTMFDGTFEGLGNTISHLSINGSTPQNLGLFAVVTFGGVVESIHLTFENIRENSGVAGGIAGVNEGLIANTAVRGVIKGTRSATIGGIAGYSSGTILSSRTAGKMEVNGYGHIGGLVGQDSGYASTRIDGSHSTAQVIGGKDSYVGGLVGILGGTLTRSWASGAVTVGDDDGKVGPPTGAGGLVGYVYANAYADGIIENCYATGAVTGGQNASIGGLIGYRLVGTQGYGPTADSYATGTLSGGTGSHVGGFIGFANGGVGDTYWDTTTSGITDPSQGAGDVANSPGITGLTTIQLQSGLPAGFDPKVWSQSATINGGLPYLLGNLPR